MNSLGDMLDLDSGETISFTLVFPPDAHIEKSKISVLGADGARMLGYRVRDEFERTVAHDYNPPPSAT
jgi:regulator of nucleoside diphosphate kinase